MRFTPKPLHIAGGVLALALLTSLITILVAGSGRGGVAEESTGLYSGPGQGAEAGDLAGPGGGGAALTAEDLTVPSEGEALGRWEWTYHRQPRSEWDESDISRYWIDPDEISIDYLVERNDDVIEEMFESVP